MTFWRHKKCIFFIKQQLLLKIKKVKVTFAEFVPCSIKIAGPKPTHIVRTYPYDHIVEYPPGNLTHGFAVTLALKNSTRTATRTHATRPHSAKQPLRWNKIFIFVCWTDHIVTPPQGIFWRFEQLSTGVVGSLVSNTTCALHIVTDTKGASHLFTLP